MVKHKIFLNSTIGLCMALCSLYPTPSSAVSKSSEKELAQGDGEVTEEILTDETAAQEEVVDTEENVATITADGDFLVPTYLLPVAEEKTSLSSETNSNTSIKKTITTTTTTTTTTKETPIYVVSNDKNPAQSTPDKEPVNTPLVDDTPVIDVQSKTTQTNTAAIPYNIGTGHQAAATPQQKNREKPIVPETPSISKTALVNTTRPILIPLAPLPKIEEPEPTVPTHVRKIVPSIYADQMLTALEENKHPDFIMPQEIKVSFYKNASHFSGQTIKWIKAFSASAMNDPRLIVQVRLSTLNPSIQQKRLSIIQNTLIGNGLSPHQIQVVFTKRPADSLVLRTTTKPEHTQVSIQSSKTGRRVEKRTTKW
ncbi:MAG: hypothetical protein IKV03_00705 [Alphaproteobacteria bacterium]|nr:hypothetical protein [Alphaproteobacteria bacterium]